MSAPKLTPWFGEEVKPVRVGVYQRRLKGGLQFSFWNGVRWGFSCVSPEMAVKYGPYESALLRPWRGLAEQPKEQA